MYALPQYFLFLYILQGQDIFQWFGKISLLPHSLQSLWVIHNKILATKVPIHVDFLFAQIL